MATFLLFMLLLLCGDTGVLLNPGPISAPDEGYLDDVDPDVNHYNDYCINL